MAKKEVSFADLVLVFQGEHHDGDEAMSLLPAGKAKKFVQQRACHTQGSQCRFQEQFDGENLQGLQ
ncbi:MAG TPA: hypothetical protein V6C97_12875 [Oculatellaceae cyanobacterium]